MKEDDQTTLTEPLLDGADDESKIPQLNPEDPLSGLTDEQVKQSLATFGKNEVSIIKLYHAINIAGCTCISHASSVMCQVPTRSAQRVSTFLLMLTSYISRSLCHKSRRSSSPKHHYGYCSSNSLRVFSHYSLSSLPSFPLPSKTTPILVSS